MVFPPRAVRNLACALAAGFAFSLAAAPASAQIDNKGREFLMAFLPNTITPLGVELHLTGDVATTVTVQYPALNPTTTLNAQVTPGQVTIVTLPFAAAQQWVENAVGSNLVRAVSEQEFVAYMVNRAGFTSDAAVALPIDALNTEYLVADYNFNIGNAPPEFVVFAAFDDTTVTITPRNAMVGHAAGVPFNVTLQRGQGFFGTAASASLTGSTISANRPVGLTNGVECTNVPNAITACDHIFEVAQPVQSWGTRALVANLPNRTEDANGNGVLDEGEDTNVNGQIDGGTIYRIIASQDGTMVSRDGTALAPVLQRGEFIEIPPLLGSHVFSANLPIFVVQYMTGTASPGAVEGDPAMGNMVPTEQYLNRYTFATLPTIQFPTQFVTVIADDRDLATITLDGNPIGAQAFSPIGSTGFSSAVLRLAAGNHNTASTQPHGITVEGYGEADSYIYPGGAQFAFINPVGDANSPLCSLQVSEPRFFTGSAQDNRPSEDVNGNGTLDPGEDLNGNGAIDDDTGIFSVQLLEGALNLDLQVDPFVPGDGIVTFRVQPSDPQAPFSGSVRASDGAGNTCERSVGGEGAFPSVTFGDWAEDVEVHVDFTPQEVEIRTAYVALQDEGVKILDVTDPDAIATLGSYEPETCPNGNGTAAFFADDVSFVESLSALFVAAGRCGVIVLDVSNPAAPAVLGRYDTPVWAEAVEVVVSGNSVIGYIADHNGGLLIVDFSNLFDGTPTAPVLRGAIGSSTAGWGTGAAIDVAFLDNDVDLLAFVAATQGLRVVNVENPASPQLIGSFNTSPSGNPPEVPQDITLSEDGDTALVAGWQAGLLAIDVSNPSQPVLLNRISTTPGNAYYESEIDGNFVFATEGKVGLRTFALTEGGLQTIEGEEPIPIADGDGWAWDVRTADGVAYVTYGILEGGTGGLTVIELEPSGILVDFGGDPGPDGDGDGTPDADDNCSDLANAGQADANQDGFGNACDADYNDDGMVAAADFSALRAAFGSHAGGPGWNAEVDHDGNGVIAAADFSVFRARMGGAPGPSGLSCAGSAPCPSP